MKSKISGISFVLLVIFAIALIIVTAFTENNILRFTFLALFTITNIVNAITKSDIKARVINIILIILITSFYFI